MKIADHSERTHSELPPSSADKWMKCHGWLRTVQQHLSLYGEPAAGAAAEAGTRAHEKLERHLLTLPITPTPAKKVLVPAGPGMNAPMKEIDPRELSEDDDEYDDLIQCIEWVQDQPGVLYPEMKIDFGQGFGYVGLTGTLDIALVEPKRLTIADLKYGLQPVEVRDPETGAPNPQLMTYLVGAVNKFGERDEYRLVILQPRAWHEDGMVRTAYVQRAELELFKFELEESISANYAGSPCQVGNWCRKYCPAIGSCKAVVAESRRRMAETPF